MRLRYGAGNRMSRFRFELMHPLRAVLPRPETLPPGIRT